MPFILMECSGFQIGAVVAGSGRPVLCVVDRALKGQAPLTPNIVPLVLYCTVLG